jgi:hypothetical protein
VKSQIPFWSIEVIRNCSNSAFWLGLLAATTSASVVQAAPRAKPKAKPAVAKPLNKPLGMVPMSGVDGKIGQTYTIDKDSPLNFTLDSAEYTLQRINFGDSSHAPLKNEKLLLLRFTVHNPQKFDRQFYWGTIHFTAVDAMNQNRESTQTVGARQTGEKVSMALKPAQKLEAYTVIKVPAKGVIPKLIVKPNNTGGVIRYDLRNVVKPLPAPFADSKDSSGATALEEVPGQLDTYYPLANLDIKLLGTAYADTLGDDFTKEANEKFFVATIMLRNSTNAETSYYWGTFQPELVDADGEKVRWPQVLLKGGRNEKASGTLKAGEEYKARLYFVLPKDVDARTLKLTDNNESHSFSFDVSGTK